MVLTPACVSPPPTSCGDEELLLDRECRPFHELVWFFHLHSASVGPERPDGEPWDADGTPPDLMVDLWGPGGGSCHTRIVQDSYDPVWDKLCEHRTFPPIERVDIYLGDTAPGPTAWSADFSLIDDQALHSLMRTHGERVEVFDESGTITLRYWIEHGGLWDGDR